MAYVKFEEDYGFVKWVMDVYECVVKCVFVDERLGVYDVYVVKVMEFFGVVKVRDVFTRVVDDGELLNDVSKMLMIRFVEFECKFGEIDCVCVLYVYVL